MGGSPRDQWKFGPRVPAGAIADRPVGKPDKPRGIEGDCPGVRGMYKPGDRVVYLATKHSAHPGPRAEDVEPEPHGEGYTYHVKKYWTVADVGSDGWLTVITRRGKRRRVCADDPHLRPARWWEVLFLRSRFPAFGVATPRPSSPRSSAA